jgi:hypothetical protein
MRNRAKRGGRTFSWRFARIVVSVGVLTAALMPATPGVMWAQGTSSMTLQSTPTCNDGNVCVWSNTSYSGLKDTFNCVAGVQNVHFNAFSIKNRCNARGVDALFDNTFKFCLPADGELPAVSRFNNIFIHASGSSC